MTTKVFVCMNGSSVNDLMRMATTYDKGIEWGVLSNMLYIAGEEVDVVADLDEVSTLVETGALSALADHIANIPWDDKVEYTGLLVSMEGKPMDLYRLHTFEYTAAMITMDVTLVV